MTSDFEQKKRAIRGCLQDLAKGRGAARAPEDIAKLLRGRLRLLGAALKLDLENSAPAIRRLLRAQIHAYLERVVPRPTSSSQPFESNADKRRYWNAARVTFNIANVPGSKQNEGARLPPVDLAAMNLMARRKWMDTPEDDLKAYRPAGYDIKISTSQRYFNDAIEQMAVILADDKHKRPASAPLASGFDVAVGDDRVTDEQERRFRPISATGRRRTMKRRLIAVARAGVVFLAAGIVASVVLSNSGNGPATYISIDKSPLVIKEGQQSSPDLLIPRPVSQIEHPPPLGPAFEAWKAKYGAVFANTMDVTFIARGSVTEPTIITGARIEIVKREAPLVGTWIAPDGGSEPPIRQLFASLDQSPAKMRTDGTWQYPLRVSDSDQEIFTVSVRTTNCHCSWWIVVSVILPNNEAADVVVDDGGKPFETTSSRAATDKTRLAYSAEEAWPQPIR